MKFTSILAHAGLGQLFRPLPPQSTGGQIVKTLISNEPEPLIVLLSGRDNAGNLVALPDCAKLELSVAGGDLLNQADPAMSGSPFAVSTAIAGKQTRYSWVVKTSMGQDVSPDPMVDADQMSISEFVDNVLSGAIGVGGTLSDLGEAPVTAIFNQNDGSVWFLPASDGLMEAGTLTPVATFSKSAGGSTWE